MLVPAPPKPLSKYAQRMKWLSDQIFNKMDKERFVNSETRSMGDWRVVRYFTERPMHLREDIRNLYYPPYGQMNNLVKVASEYGLFRNEHQDFNEEMERMRQARSKTKCRKFKFVKKDKKKK